MKTLYYVTSSINFNNIFSTESISPPSYYKKRNFGNSKFRLTYESPDLGFLILYERIPKLVLQDSEIEEYVVHFKLYVDESDIFEITSGVWGHPSTFYLNVNNCKILFQSEKERSTILFLVERSLTTKSIDKYLESIDLAIYTDSLTSVWNGNFSYIYNIDHEIARDRIYNSYKGLLYLAAIHYYSVAQNSHRLLAYIQDFINVFAQYKNTWSPKSNRYQEVKESFSRLQSEFESCYQLTEVDYVNDYLSDLLSQNKIPEELDSLIRRILFQFASELEVLDKLNTHSVNVKGEGSDPQTSLYLIRVLLSELKVLKDIKLLNNYDEEIKNYLHQIIRFCENQKIQSTLVLPIFDVLKYDFNSRDIDITVQRFLKEEKDHESLLYCFNILLNHIRSDNSRVSEDYFIPLVEKVTKALYPDKNYKRSKLYRYLIREVKHYDVEKDSTNVALLNLFAFITHPNELSNLDTFLLEKGLQNPEIAFAYWGLFNGFSNIPKNFSKVIFESKNNELQIAIDNHLAEVLRDLKKVPADKLPTMLRGKHSDMDNSLEMTYISKLGIGAQDLIRKFDRLKSEVDDYILKLPDKETTKIKSNKSSILKYFENLKPTPMFPDEILTIEEYYNTINTYLKDVAHVGNKKTATILEIFKSIFMNSH